MRGELGSTLQNAAQQFAINMRKLALPQHAPDLVDVEQLEFEFADQHV